MTRPDHNTFFICSISYWHGLRANGQSLAAARDLHNLPLDKANYTTKAPPI